MYAVLPQPGARTSAAIAVVIVVAGFVLSVVMVRGILATVSVHAWMAGPTPLVESAGEPHPQLPPK
jgi:hypothetical protein